MGAPGFRYRSQHHHSPWFWGLLSKQEGVNWPSYPMIHWCPLLLALEAQSSGPGEGGEKAGGTNVGIKRIGEWPYFDPEPPGSQLLPTLILDGAAGGHRGPSLE